MESTSHTYKKEAPKPKYPAKMKRGFQVRYDASKQETIKGGFKFLKKTQHKRVSPYEFTHEIPGDDAGTATVKKFKGDCDIETISQCCITTDTLTGNANLDVKMGFSIKEDNKIVDKVKMSLRDILMNVEVEGKPLIRLVADVDATTALVISATGADRDAALANICQYISTWSIYTLVFKYKATAALVEVALRSWFDITHATAAIEFSEYDLETSVVSMDVSSGDQEGHEAQKLLSKGLMGMSILKGGDVDTEE